MFNLLILFAVAGLIGYLIGREVKERAVTKEEVSESVPQPSILGRLQKINPFARGVSDQEQFATWLAGSSTAVEPLAAWYNEADDKTQKAFVNDLAHFVGSFGAKVAWLNDTDLQTNAPDLYASTVQLVNDFSATYLKADGAKSHLAVIAQLEQWQANPATQAHQATTEGIYTKLTESEAITAELSQKGSGRKKREAMAEAIQQYRVEKPAEFYAVFTAVVTGAESLEAEVSEVSEPAKPQPRKRTSAATTAASPDLATA